MSFLHKDLSTFQTCAIRLELLLHGMENALQDRSRRFKTTANNNYIEDQEKQMDAIQKDQILFAFSLLQEMRHESKQQRVSPPMMTMMIPKDTSTSKHTDEEEEEQVRVLNKLTEQVQYYLNHLKPSIKDSIVNHQKQTKICLNDLILGLEKDENDSMKSSSHQTFTSTYPSTLTPTAAGTTTTTTTGRTSKVDTTTTAAANTKDSSSSSNLVYPTASSQQRIPTKEKSIDFTLNPGGMEPEVISHRLQQDIATMAQQLKHTSLNIHKSLQNQNLQLQEMESLAQESIDKTKHVTEKVQDHVRRNWKQIIGRWFLFFIIVGTWMFCFLIIRTIPKRKLDSYTYDNNRYKKDIVDDHGVLWKENPTWSHNNIHHYESSYNNICTQSKWICSIKSYMSQGMMTRNVKDRNAKQGIKIEEDDMNDSKQWESSSSCSSPPSSHRNMLMEEEPSSSSSSCSSLTDWSEEE